MAYLADGGTQRPQRINILMAYLADGGTQRP